MKRVLFSLLFIFNLAVAEEEGVNYGIYRNASNLFPIEKEFIVMLKPTNPDNLATSGYIKFRATIIAGDKSAFKELEAKADIVRSVVIDAVSGYLAMDLQGTQGRQKLGAELTASVNAVLTDSSIVGFAFPDIVIQPPR